MNKHPIITPEQPMTNSAQQYYGKKLFSFHFFRDLSPAQYASRLCRFAQTKYQRLWTIREGKKPGLSSVYERGGF